MRCLTLSRIVTESPAAAFRRWTTSDGAVTFFAPRANIDLRLGGPYELYFLADAPPGGRGSEDCRVLAFVPNEMLAFSWSAPPEWPDLRRERTFVVVRFDAADAGGGARVRLDHLGWGEGPGWDELFAYFERAWNVVLDRMVRAARGEKVFVD